MGIIFSLIGITFCVLLIINVLFFITNMIFWAQNGLQVILEGMNFTDRLYFSTYLKWIMIADILWISIVIGFALKRKHYKTDPEKHYLTNQIINEPKICVIIPTYNEEKSIRKIVEEYKKQKNVIKVIVIDNHSEDQTVNIAKNCGATVITKKENKGYTDSCIMGFVESLKTDANIIVLTEADATFSGYDIAKMTPYLDNCDLVIGTRQVQVMNEKGNQNSMFYVWGNLFLAKLLQMKYFSLLHIGNIEFTDVGCTYRSIRKEALQKIIQELTEFNQNGQKNLSFSPIGLKMIMISIENELRIIEIPITFKKRIGTSKTQVTKKINGIKYGLSYLWLILSS